LKFIAVKGFVRLLVETVLSGETLCLQVAFFTPKRSLWVQWT